MSQFEASLRMPGETGPGLGVIIDLSDSTLRLTSNGSEIGSWERHDVRVNALVDGFHLRAEGEEIILDVGEDAHFAVELGITTAPPLLRRRMSALLRED